MKAPSQQPPQAGSRRAEPVTRYQADTFTLDCAEGWHDKTLFTLAGPVTDGIQHTVLITVEQEAPYESVREFAEAQIAALEGELRACRLLKKGPLTLASGLPAYQAIFSWYPAAGLKVYQEQVYVLDSGRACRLTATFTKKTRKTLGPQVERMMLSFSPVKPPRGSSGAAPARRE
jgi:hypothetical protein